ncbi:tetratricopeptide repeat protein [Jiulongibacter sediminis]|uniref:Uncharacterized protein n=1 Tax=Jiulongibacter sediminis TaxID=1605367 RepID=A0A0N8HAA2_9BACT|nr:tetratricopeptide repeat protein [Jiulongibacter sediminis]KPM49604.1 hypothetical protein AFM12_03125 [Jiulongibacter sediminis]TBX26642.1 hypothetical protein TK44_03130 [Jiulongibacter sediminis]
MQNLKYIFICLFFTLFVQITDSQGQSHFAQKADSLFSEKKYQEAANLYTDLIKKHDINKGLAYLKLAYIHENQGEFSLAIYYLNEYHKLHPDEKVFDKINQMAAENGFQGYGQSDLNFFSLIVQKNTVWVLLIATLIITYSFVILFLKRNKNITIPRAHKVSLTLGILAVLLVINFPKVYKTGIINKKEAFVREMPAAAAGVVETLSEGSKVNIIGKKDIWLKLWEDGKIRYIKENDLWIIGQE